MRQIISRGPDRHVIETALDGGGTGGTRWKPMTIGQDLKFN
jgi:hypothetical protein